MTDKFPTAQLLRAELRDGLRSASEAKLSNIFMRGGRRIGAKLAKSIAGLFLETDPHAGL